MNQTDKLHIDFSAEEAEIMDSVRERIGAKHPLHYIETFGCQMNVHDSEKLAGMLRAMGYAPAGGQQNADLILFNTCCIREHAESKVFGHLGALLPLKEENPELVVAVCGCMMQQKEVALRVKSRFPFVDIIFGTHNLHRFPKLLHSVLVTRARAFEVYDSPGGVVEGVPVSREKGAQAFVTIMYGCDNFCTYCIVPYVRGRERSRAREDILQEVRALADEGVKEVTVLGQNVNSYGKDLPGEYGFARLLRDIAEIGGIERIRFMTSHPKDVSPALIRAMAEYQKICKHIHLPVQSGSSRILKAMNRMYMREEYLELLGRLKAEVDGLEVTTDVIVGFPGETEKDFEATLDLVRQAGYSAAYTFMYSPREGTPAAKLPDQVPKAVKKERLLKLNALIAGMIAEQNEAYIGRRARVLVEGVRTGKDGEAVAYGRSHASKTVYFTGNAQPGEMADVEITHAREASLYGRQTDA